MSLKYIKDYYDVPADRGSKVEYNGKVGTIIGSSGPHLKVRFQDEKHCLILHPTWKVQYLTDKVSNENA